MSQTPIGKLKHGQLAGTTSGTPGTSLPISIASVRVRNALIVADSANTAPISFGPTTDANFDKVLPGQTYALPRGIGAEFADLSDLYVKSADAFQAFRVLGLFLAGNVLVEYSTDNGVDPVIGPPYPPTNYQLYVTRDSTGQHLTWTVPDLTISVAVIIGAGSGTPPGYAYFTVTNYADTWVAQAYASGDKVLYNHNFYQANAATVGSDVPGVSIKWDALAAITWKLYWRDNLANQTFAAAIPPSSPPYLLGRCWWADHLNIPASAPDDKIRIGARIDDYYGVQAARFTFYISATAGLVTLTSQNINVDVPIPS